MKTPPGGVIVGWILASRVDGERQFSGLVVIDERRRAPLTELLPNRPNVG
jgi:hypothetical protein